MLLKGIAAAVAGLLFGCGGIAHFSTSPISVAADAAAIEHSAEVVVLQAYNKKDFLGEESLSILLGSEEHAQRKVIKPSANGVFRVEFTPFMRADVLWIIPPFFSLFIDQGSYLLVRFDGGAIYGFAIDDGSLKETYRLGPRNRLMKAERSELPFAVETRVKAQQEATIEVYLKAPSPTIIERAR